MTPYPHLSAAILIFPDVELLDFAGPYEVLSAVRRPPDRLERLMDVFTVAETMAPVHCRNGLVVQPAYTLAGAPRADVLVIPGGQGTRTAVHRPALIGWILARSREAQLTTSVCTGSFLLAEAGLLNGRPATTHWGSIDRLRQMYPRVHVRAGERFVDDDTIVTSAGVSAGIDMALHLVARLYNPDIAAQTARGIEYDHYQSSLW